MEDKYYNHLEWFPRSESKLGIEENAMCILATIGNGSIIGMTQMLINHLSYTSIPEYQINEYLDLLIDRGHIKEIFQLDSPEDWRYIATKKGELKLIDFKDNFDKQKTNESKPIKGRRKNNDKTNSTLLEYCFLHFYNDDPITTDNKALKSKKYGCAPDTLYIKYRYLLRNIISLASSGKKKSDDKRIGMYEKLIPLITLPKNQKKAKTDLENLRLVFENEREVNQDYG